FRGRRMSCSPRMSSRRWRVSSVSGTASQIGRPRYCVSATACLPVIFGTLHLGRLIWDALSGTPYLGRLIWDAWSWTLDLGRFTWDGPPGTLHLGRFTWDASSENVSSGTVHLGRLIKSAQFCGIPTSFTSLAHLARSARMNSANFSAVSGVTWKP